MAGNDKIKPTTSSLRELNPTGGQQATEGPSTPMLSLKQRDAPINPAASMRSTSQVKTLENAVDPNKPRDESTPGSNKGQSSLLDSEKPGFLSPFPIDEYESEWKTWATTRNTLLERPPDAAKQLERTWRDWEKLANMLKNLAKEPGLSGAQLVNIERDQRLAEALVRTLQKEKLADDSAEAQNARAFMKVVLNLRHRQHHMTLAFRPRQAEVNVYAEKRADAIRFIRDHRPSLGVVGNALVKIEDLYTDVLNEPRLAHRVTAAQREQLGRDLQTLHALIDAGRANGWLPDVDPSAPKPGTSGWVPDAGQSASESRTNGGLPDADQSTSEWRTNGGLPDADQSTSKPPSQDHMEKKIKGLAAAISDHFQKILTTKGGIEDDEELDQLDHARMKQVSDAKTFLSVASNTSLPPGTPPWLVVARQQVADALIKAHRGRRRGPGRGREIMDSLPPGYVTGLLARGAHVEDIARNLTRCADLLHVSQSGFQEGTGRFAFLKGIWKGIRFSNGRALSSWQAALVRRSVAMLVLAGAPKSEVRKVRDSLVSGLRAASGRIGTDGKWRAEASVSLVLWDKQSSYSLSEYRQEIERTVANRGEAEKERWSLLTNLHTVMGNLSTVLRDPDCSVDDALTVFNHDMGLLDADQPAGPDAVKRDDGVLPNGGGSTPGGDVPLLSRSSDTGGTPRKPPGPLPAIDQPEHAYAYLLKSAVEGSQHD